MGLPRVCVWTGVIRCWARNPSCICCEMTSIALKVPTILTKELAIQRNASSGERWIRLSSNLLDGYGFSPNTRIERRVLGPGAGFALEVNPAGATKVYRRTYNQRRRNNPCSVNTQIDLKSQSFLDAAIPHVFERVHFTLKAGVIVARPVPERTFHIRKRLRMAESPLETFVALSSGVDAACLASEGFRMRALLEYRPNEKRDTNDLTETGVLTALSNNSFNIVLNENIFTVDMARIRGLLGDGPQLGLLHVSPQCDDFSSLKTKAARDASVAELTTTRDMVYDVLRLIETTEPASVCVENVPGFGTSAEGLMLLTRLRRWGYHVWSDVLDAREHLGNTSRRRFYAYASVFPGFVPPPPQEPRITPIWSLIEPYLDGCNDVSSTRTVAAGIETGRIRLITPESTHAPTITKSQARQTKDAIYIKTADGRYLLPNEDLLKVIQGIPTSFDLNAVSAEIGTEQIGQSIDFPMHHQLVRAIRAHLDANWRGEPVKIAHAPIGQLDLSGIEN